jgi:DNA repair protein RAD16
MQHFSFFNKHIVNPIKKFGNVGEGGKAFLMLRDQVLSKVMLRRTKKERAEDIKLPPLNVKIQKIKLEPAERDFYNGIVHSG